MVADGAHVDGMCNCPKEDAVNLLKIAREIKRNHRGAKQHVLHDRGLDSSIEDIDAPPKSEGYHQ